MARFTTRYSRNRFTLRQHVVLLCLESKRPTTHRVLVDESIEELRVRETLGLGSLPAASTLCKAFDCFEMAVRRVLLTISLADLPLNRVTSIDASGIERALASTHYTNNPHHPAVEENDIGRYGNQRGTRQLRDGDTRKHSTQIAPPVVKRNATTVAVLTGDKGYDDQSSVDSPVTTVVGHSSSTVDSPYFTWRGEHD